MNMVILKRVYFRQDLKCKLLEKIDLNTYIKGLNIDTEFDDKINSIPNMITTEFSFQNIK